MSLQANLVTLIFILFASTNGLAQAFHDKPPGYAIASAHPLATQAGLRILAEGGNAFDAAVAVAAALAVVEPYDSGLGGGAFWLLHLENTHENVFVDAREMSPGAAYKNMFLADDGKVVPELSLNGGLAAAIPGQVAALDYVAKHYGRLPLANSLAPAIKLAKEGFLVDSRLNALSSEAKRIHLFKKYPATAAIFLKQGKPYAIGEKLVQTDLANTLSLIAEKGSQGFYSGEVASHLVRGVNAAGGVWALNDLAHYQVKIRQPLIGAYRNMLIITAPPPSGGGVSLLTMCNVLSQYPIQSFSKLKWIHYVVEAMRLAYWQEGQFVGDPDVIKIPLDYLISNENAKQLSTLISPDQVRPSKELGSLEIKQGSNTSHFSIIDGEGNRVAVTQTLNYYFGSSVVAAGTGVLLNDGMDDFSIKVGSKNVFGVVGSEKNSIAPYKRPVSHMTPTFLELPGRVAVLGTPGGSRIPTMVLLASLVFHDSYGAISMVSAMRFHHQYLPDILEFEPDTFPADVQEGLKRMGYHLKQVENYFGNMQAITWDKATNKLTAASDPRQIGLAVTVLTPQPIP